MPSDPRVAEVIKLLRPAAEPFRAAIVAALDELNAFLAEQRVPHTQRIVREAALLGEFATGRIDPAKFAELAGNGKTLDSIRLGRLEQAQDVLREFATRGDELYHITVLPGTDLRDRVRQELAWRGRVFNAAHAFELVRAGASLRAPVGETLDFRDWTRAQRGLAAPLIVSVEGSDLEADGLSEYLDGTMKMVLLVNRPAAPAPLARLVAPATFVQQTNNIEDVTQLRDYAGAGITAVLPEGCARFVHDPRQGAHLPQRLRVDFLPEPPTHAVAGGSLRQQLQDLTWLGELARIAASLPNANVQAEPDPAEAPPADRLAAWLLRQTDLDAQ